MNDQKFQWYPDPGSSMEMTIAGAGKSYAD